MAGVLLLATAVQVASGFGFAVIAVPLLVLIIPARTATETVIVTDLPLVALVAFKDRALVRWDAVRGVTLWAILGIPLGVALLRRLNTEVLSCLLGASLLGIGVAMARVGRSLRGTWHVRLGGVASGVLLGVSAMCGPPVLAVLSGLTLDMRQVRATAAAVFTVEAAVGVVLLAASGSFAASLPRLEIVGLPAVAVGIIVGEGLFSRLSDDKVRYAVVLLLIASGLSMVIRTVR